jgi:beta-phosphoglucomutase
MKQVAVIFDLDGVIVDTAKYHFIAWQQIADKLGIHFTLKDNELLKGVSRVKSLEIILKLENIQLTDKEKQRLLQEKNQYYLSLIANMNPGEMLPGIPDFLSDLHDKKIPFALGSASKNAITILRALQIIDLFDAVVDGNAVQKAKPDPEVFLKAANRLDIAPENCIVIEDAQAGIKAARNAGMFCIGIGNNTILKEADMVLSGTDELNAALIHRIRENKM